jgi:hypothetical protein
VAQGVGPEFKSQQRIIIRRNKAGTTCGWTMCQVQRTQQERTMTSAPPACLSGRPQEMMGQEVLSGTRDELTPTKPGTLGHPIPLQLPPEPPPGEQSSPPSSHQSPPGYSYDIIGSQSESQISRCHLGLLFFFFNFIFSPLQAKSPGPPKPAPTPNYTPSDRVTFQVGTLSAER